MYKKDFYARLKVIKEAVKKDYDNSQHLYEKLVDDLYNDENHDLIIQLFDTSKVNHLAINSFNTAFVLRKKNRNKEAERIYRNILEIKPNDIAVLNNLSVIVESRDIYEAFKLIDKANSLTSEDEIVLNNYRRIKSIIEDIEKKDGDFKIAVKNIENENTFVRNKLNAFFSSINTVDGYNNNSNTVAIPNWQFKVLMKTDETKADSLRRQWIDKGYICETNDRNEYRVIIYEINPYILDELKRISSFDIDETWIEGINHIDKEYLTKIGYYRIITKLKKVKKKFRYILLRDFNEFIINYIFQNNKSVVVISGSLVETLLIYYLEKQKVNNIVYSIKNRQVSKKLYEAQLGDLLNFLEENHMLTKQIVHLGNVTRLYRNYIHPGKELRDANDIDKVKAELCFNSISELINEVIR